MTAPGAFLQQCLSSISSQLAAEAEAAEMVVPAGVVVERSFEQQCLLTRVAQRLFALVMVVMEACILLGFQQVGKHQH